MSLPSKQEALAFFEYVIAERNRSPFPFRPEWEKEFRAHCFSVADIAAKIASQTPYLNSERAYLSGLLHDWVALKMKKVKMFFMVGPAIS